MLKVQQNRLLFTEQMGHVFNFPCKYRRDGLIHFLQHKVDIFTEKHFFNETSKSLKHKIYEMIPNRCHDFEFFMKWEESFRLIYLRYCAMRINDTF